MALVGHQAIEDWMGEQVLTLADLGRDRPRALIVGINPAPRSVAAGHYYQGPLGQRFYERLRQAGVLDRRDGGWEDDAAVAAGFGFTDVVKRPTARADGVRAEEFTHGVTLLRSKVAAVRPDVVIFTFKKAASAMIGRFDGAGLVPSARVEGARVFVMPGPYAARSDVARHLGALTGVLGG